MTFEMIDERQLKAMEEIGRMRSQAIGWSFAITLAIVFGIAVLTGFRITLGLASGIALGGIVSKLYVDARKDGIVSEACAKFGIDRAVLDAEKYIIDQGPK